MSEEKYYVPNVTEFCYGLECEIKVRRATGLQWEKHEIGFEYDLEYLYHLKEQDRIRVKHLDRSDIMEFGFVFDSDPSRTGTIGVKGDDNMYEIDFLGDDRIMIDLLYLVATESNDSPVYSSKSLFNGKIRNKSELGRVLKQIGVV